MVRGRNYDEAAQKYLQAQIVAHLKETDVVEGTGG